MWISLLVVVSLMIVNGKLNAKAKCVNTSKNRNITRADHIRVLV